MKRIILLIMALLLLAGCSSVEPEIIHSVPIEADLQEELPVEKCKVGETLLDGECLKNREPTRIGEVVIIYGRLFIDGDDTQEEEFPKPCCYPRECPQ